MARRPIGAPEDIARTLVAALSERDAARLEGLLDPDVVFEPASTPVSERAPYRGADGMRSYLADLDRTWDEFEVTVTEIRERAPYVVALCRIWARAPGFVADSPAALVLEVRDGLLVWGKTFTDRAEALRAAGLQ